MHAVVGGAMAVVALVIANHYREIANLKCFARHGEAFFFSAKNIMRFDELQPRAA
jgi:hypothetical protein